MIKAKLLNSDASLNDFIYVGSVEFVPGENVTVAFQLFHAVRGIRHVPPVAATVELTFLDSSGTEVVKTAAVISADDRSMWKIDLTQVETETLAGQTITGEIDYNGDASVIYRFVMENAFIRTNLAGDC